jgi:hypothetical protein
LSEIRDVPLNVGNEPLIQELRHRMRLGYVQPYSQPDPNEMTVRVVFHAPALKFESHHSSVTTPANGVVIEVLGDVAKARKVGDTIIKFDDAVNECRLELVDSCRNPDSAAETGQGHQQEVEINLLSPDFFARIVGIDEGL